MESYADPHSILPNHTEGHRLNGRDALSRKAGLRLGKDSAGVGVKNLLGQSSLKYCRRRGLNRCPLAWELGTLPLDQLDLSVYKLLNQLIYSPYEYIRVSQTIVVNVQTGKLMLATSFSG